MQALCCTTVSPAPCHLRAPLACRTNAAPGASYAPAASKPAGLVQSAPELHPTGLDALCAPERPRSGGSMSAAAQPDAAQLHAAPERSCMQDEQPCPAAARRACQSPAAAAGPMPLTPPPVPAAHAVPATPPAKPQAAAPLQAVARLAGPGRRAPSERPAGRPGKHTLMQPPPPRPPQPRAGAQACPPLFCTPGGAASPGPGEASGSAASGLTPGGPSHGVHWAPTRPALAELRLPDNCAGLPTQARAADIGAHKGPCVKTAQAAVGLGPPRADTDAFGGAAPVGHGALPAVGRDGPGPATELLPILGVGAGAAPPTISALPAAAALARACTQHGCLPPPPPPRTPWAPGPSAGASPSARAARPASALCSKRGDLDMLPAMFTMRAGGKRFQCL